MPGYRDLEVWKRSLHLVTEIYRVAVSLPSDERFGLAVQLRRAAVSTSCNIAEGYGRATRGEYLNQLSVARGSLNELETLCEICLALGFLQAGELAVVENDLDQMRRMLGRLRLRLQVGGSGRKPR